MRRILLVVMLLRAVPAPAPPLVAPECVAGLNGAAEEHRYEANPGLIRRVLGAAGIILEIAQGGEAVTYYVAGEPSRVVRHLQPAERRRPVAERAQREFDMLTDVQGTGNPGKAHVITATAVHPNDGVIVMPYLDGALPMYRYVELREQGAAALAGLMRQALSAVSAVHAAGIVHRDLKPDNLLVSANGHVTLIDFGIAIRAADGLRMTTAAGTPGYIPGNILHLNRPAQDVFALQRTLHELVLQLPAAERNSDLGKRLLSVALLPDVVELPELSRLLRRAETASSATFYRELRRELARVAEERPRDAAYAILHDPELSRQFLASPRSFGFDRETLQDVVTAIREFRVEGAEQERQREILAGPLPRGPWWWPRWPFGR